MRLSLLSRAAKAEGARSSREPACLEDVSDIAETDPGVPPAPEIDVALAMGSATVCIRGLAPVNELVR